LRAAWGDHQIVVVPCFRAFKNCRKVLIWMLRRPPFGASRVWYGQPVAAAL